MLMAATPASVDLFGGSYAPSCVLYLKYLPQRFGTHMQKPNCLTCVGLGNGGILVASSCKAPRTWTWSWNPHATYHELGVEELESSTTLTKILCNCVVSWHGIAGWDLVLCEGGIFYRPMCHNPSRLFEKLYLEASSMLLKDCEFN
jgi:hypothetical protein